MFAGAPPGYGPAGATAPAMNTMDQSLMRYQEGMAGGHGHAHHETIDENGIAPRRCSDIMFVPIFLVHLIIMLCITVAAMSHGDLRRLSHGFDYKADLCGVDADVADKPFQFWCRADSLEMTALPSAINTNETSCIAECPTSPSSQQVACLQAALNWNDEDANSVAGSVKNYVFWSEQSVVKSYPYETELFGGRYCLPKDVTLRDEVLHSASFRSERIQAFWGSFKDIWLVMFFAVLLSIGLGFVYIASAKVVAKYIIYAFLFVAMAIFYCLGIFFILALIPLIPGVDKVFDGYEAANPVYSRHTDVSAGVISAVIGIICITIGCSFTGYFNSIAESMVRQYDLMCVAWECITAMPQMLILPVVSAMMKFFLYWILLSNFTYLMSVGWIEDRRIIINGEERQGLSRVYHYDWSYWFWVLYYIFGSVWILELVNCFDHFITSFAVLSWWYTPVENGSKAHPPPSAMLMGAHDAFAYHFGSLVYGALVTPYTRVPRLLSSIIFQHSGLPGDGGEDPFGAKLCGRQVKWCCGCLDIDNSKYYAKDGYVAMFTKNSFNDIIIRSNNYFQGCIRVVQVFNSHKACANALGRLASITLVGVLGVGITSSLIMYWIITGSSTYTDPASSWYVADPIAVLVVSFCLCGWVGYGFCLLLEHTADMLLYCYAWNKKIKKGTVVKHIPEKLRLIVGFEDKNPDGYPMYGKAHPKMYLSTFFDTSAAPAAKAKPAPPPASSQAPPMASAAYQQPGPGFSQQDVYGGAAPNYYGGGGLGVNYPPGASYPPGAAPH